MSGGLSQSRGSCCDLAPSSRRCPCTVGTASAPGATSLQVTGRNVWCRLKAQHGAILKLQSFPQGACVTAQLLRPLRPECSISATGVAPRALPENFLHPNLRLRVCFLSTPICSTPPPPKEFPTPMTVTRFHAILYRLAVC